MDFIIKSYHKIKNYSLYLYIVQEKSPLNFYEEFKNKKFSINFLEN